MAHVNAGARLDRLPITPFHYRIFWLIGAGMFFDGYDLYVADERAAGGAAERIFDRAAQVPQFISWTFVGMTIGAVVAGFLGDEYGRRFTYQFNLVMFGLASFAAALAPDMDWLIAARFVMGLGLGAEIVVGYSTHDGVRAAAIARPLDRRFMALSSWWRAFPPRRSSASWSSRTSAGGRCSSSPASAR